MLFLTFLVAAALGAVSLYPRQMVILGNERYVGHYTGLGVLDDNSMLGYQFYKFTIDDSPYRYLVIHYDGTKFGPIEVRYPDGSLALEGTCGFEGSGRSLYPVHDIFDTAISYRPDGSVAAVTKNGTGKVVLFYPSGQLHWEWELRNHERAWYKLYEEDGTLKGASPNAPMDDEPTKPNPQQLNE